MVGHGDKFSIQRKSAGGRASPLRALYDEGPGGPKRSGGDGTASYSLMTEWPGLDFCRDEGGSAEGDFQEERSDQCGGDGHEYDHAVDFIADY